MAQQHGFFVYESPPLYRTFEPFVLLKKYKNKHAGDITALAISPDSRFLVSCGEDYLIYLNNLFPIRDYLPICLEVHRYKIISVSYSHDMVYLYSTDSGGNLFIWKWTEEYLSEGYLNLRASKKRKLDNRRGVSSKNDEEAEEGTEPAWEYMSEVERKINSGRYILEQKCVISNAGGHLKRVVFKRAMGFLATAYSHGKFAIYKLVGK